MNNYQLINKTVDALTGIDNHVAEFRQTLQEGFSSKDNDLIRMGINQFLHYLKAETNTISDVYTLLNVPGWNDPPPEPDTSTEQEHIINIKKT